MPLARRIPGCITAAVLLGVPLALSSTPAAAAEPPVLAVPADTPPSGLRVHSVSLVVTVAEGENISERLRSIAAQLGGIALTCSSDHCTLKLPVARIQDFVQRVSALGRADRPHIDVQDVTEQYVDLGSRVTAIAHVLEQLKKADELPGATEARLQLQRERQRLLGESTALQGQARALLEQTRTALITVTVDHPLRAPSESISFRLPVSWLDELGYGHLMNPPTSYKRHRSSLDGRFLLQLGVPGDRDKLDVASTTLVAGCLRGGASAKGSAIGWSMGADAEVGVGFGSGVAYGFRFLLGPALFLGNRTVITLNSGLGGDAIRGGALAGAGSVPLELSVTTDLGKYLRLNLFSRPQWVLGSSSRQDGSAHAPLGDEWANGGWLSIGRRKSSGKSTGLLLGFTWFEAKDTALYSGMLGYSGTLFESGD
jgi:hypothetical protein